MGNSFSIADVSDPNFIDKIDEDLQNIDIAGIAYCIGSIDLKPINLVTRKDLLKSFELNLFPIVEIVKKYKENLKKETTKYLDIFKDHPYIFNLGHGILPETNPEYVDYLVKFVKNY